ncbi:hypothetical protein BGW38_005570, partial [Lunasporangiospora selenospora]
MRAVRDGANLAGARPSLDTQSTTTAPVGGRLTAHTHTRNYSSPSLLDSFTSPDPMLSPIQSYFGSDPNSPATSFSLPRHEHYTRLWFDDYHEAMNSMGLVDGYHGYATHPWSEQSMTPLRALSHRWTRRSSQSDAQTASNSLLDEIAACARIRRSSAVLPRSFPSADELDPTWQETILGSSTGPRMISPALTRDSNTTADGLLVDCAGGDSNSGLVDQEVEEDMGSAYDNDDDDDDSNNNEDDNQSSNNHNNNPNNNNIISNNDHPNHLPRDQGRHWELINEDQDAVPADGVDRSIMHREASDQG